MAHLGFRAPTQVPGTVGPSFAPSNLPFTMRGGGDTQTAGNGGGFTVVQLTDGVYIAAASPAFTDAPLWVNISEPGTW